MAETQSRKRTTREPTGGARSPAADQDDGEHAAPVCTVAFCPICLVVTAAQGAAPETVDHLLKAAREFFMAARAVIDVRGDHLAQDGASGPTRLEKIEIA